MKDRSAHIIPKQPGLDNKGKEPFFSFGNAMVSAKPFFQAKLTVNSPDDLYEKEADAVADAVLKKPSIASSLPANILSSVVTPAPVKTVVPMQATQIQEKGLLENQQKPIMEELPFSGEKLMDNNPMFSSVRSSFVARKCDHCEEEEKISRKPIAFFIQKKEAATDNAISDNVAGKINSTKGNGSTMDASTKSFMEGRFGVDFSGVKIHTGIDAIQMSGELNAQAFTVGNDIYFNSGKYNPALESGQHLLAHELTHTVQQGGGISTCLQHKHISSDIGGMVNQGGDITKRKRDAFQPADISGTRLRIAKQDMDAGVSDPHDAGLPGGLPFAPPPPVPHDDPVPRQTQQIPQPNQQRVVTPVQAITCTTPYRTATTFQALIDLVRAAETRLSTAGISSTQDQIHALRGIYYGTLWSLDFSVENSVTRNEGFQRFTRPSAADPGTTVPRDIRAILDCGLFSALQTSQDMVDSGRHFDFGHLIIALDARYDSSFGANVQYPNPISSYLPGIDLGGTGTELVTWLGDLGGGASALATSRVSRPATSASTVFTGSDYGGSINLEGDIAGFVVATSGTPTAPQAPVITIGSGKLSDALQAYLSPGSVSPAWRNRATTFLRMYGGTFDASNILTNSAALISIFQTKIQAFACNYLASRVSDHHITFAQASAASLYINTAAQEVATTFVNALIDSHTTSNRIEAARFPTPGTSTSAACSTQIGAASVLGVF